MVGLLNDTEIIWWKTTQVYEMLSLIYCNNQRLSGVYFVKTFVRVFFRQVISANVHLRIRQQIRSRQQRRQICRSSTVNWMPTSDSTVKRTTRRRGSTTARRAPARRSISADVSETRTASCLSRYAKASACCAPHTGHTDRSPLVDKCPPDRPRHRQRQRGITLDRLRRR